jgi:hypothetical protein
MLRVNYEISFVASANYVEELALVALGSFRIGCYADNHLPLNFKK